MLTFYRTGKIVRAEGADSKGCTEDAPCEFDTVDEAIAFFEKMQGCNNRYTITVAYFKAIGMY